MTDRPTIKLEDLPPAVRRKLGKVARRRRPPAMPLRDVRSYALRVLAVLAHLTEAERARILRHALKVNDV